MTKTALVTGDAGFIGRHVRDALVERGYEVVGCDIARNVGEDCRELFKSEPGHPHGYGRRYQHGSAVIDAGTQRYDLVVHCAAVVGGRTTISDDPLAIAVDLEIDAAMFRWAVRTKQSRVVYWSSCAAYPAALQIPDNLCHEGDLDPIRGWAYDVHADYDAGRFLESFHPTVGLPDMTYGWAKVTGELLAHYARQQGVAVHVLRPFSGYGEDQDLSYPFPKFIDRACQREDPFEVWGTGTQVRDFVHVDDIIGTMFAVIAQDVQEPLNIGHGRPTNFLELAALVTKRVGYSPPIRALEDKPTGPSYRVADTAISHKIYKPEVSLEEGIDRAIKAWSDRMPKL